MSQSHDGSVCSLPYYEIMLEASEYGALQQTRLIFPTLSFDSGYKTPPISVSNLRNVVVDFSLRWQIRQSRGEWTEMTALTDAQWTDWANHTACLQAVQKDLLPLSGIELSFLARPASSLVTIRTKLSGHTACGYKIKQGKQYSRSFPMLQTSNKIRRQKETTAL